MTEEELIKHIKKLLFDYTEVYDDKPIIQGLLELYNKQKEEIKELKEEIDQMNKNKWEDWLEENE